MDEIRIGVAGLGHRGVYWVNQLARTPGYRVTALYDYFTALHEPALDSGASVLGDEASTDPTQTPFASTACTVTLASADVRNTSAIIEKR